MAAKRKKRPTDVIGNAVHVMKLLTGEIEPTQESERPPKDPAAASLGRRGGQARAKRLTAKKRSEIAKKAARARWNG
jgi:hypothetical protein